MKYPIVCEWCAMKNTSLIYEHYTIMYLLITEAWLIDTIYSVSWICFRKSLIHYRFRNNKFWEALLNPSLSESIMRLERKQYLPLPSNLLFLQLWKFFLLTKWKSSQNLPSFLLKNLYLWSLISNAVLLIRFHILNSLCLLSKVLGKPLLLHHVPWYLSYQPS